MDHAASHPSELVEGTRVVVPEGYTGTVIHVGNPTSDHTKVYILLDAGMGSGEWMSSEIEKVGTTDASVDPSRVATSDYPELGTILTDRPDHPAAIPEEDYLAMAPLLASGMERTALYLPLRDTARPDQGEGPYAEGFAHGVEGISQTPTNHDPAYMAQYLLGWAQGVKEGRAKEDPAYTTDLVAEEPMPEPAPNVTMSGIIGDFLDGVTTEVEPGRNYSYDWCRFRRNSHCYYPKQLHRGASEIEGYAVWIPEDRGYCPRIKWDTQEACGVSEPGPNVPGGLMDATVPYEEGGQQGGIPVQASADFDPDGFGWHYRAAWGDVRDKGRDIRRNGKVRVLSVIHSPDGTPEMMVGTVRGATDTYETRLDLAPGSHKVASWECTCKWATYSWGRTGPWKKYEGRMCSHALALMYEMQSQELSGLDTYEEPEAYWVAKRGSTDDGSWATVKHLVSSGAPIASIHQALMDRGISAGVRTTAHYDGAMQGKIDDEIVNLVFRDGQVYYNGERYDGPVIYPSYDPVRGLDDAPHTGSRQRTAAAEPTTQEDGMSAEEWGMIFPDEATKQASTNPAEIRRLALAPEFGDDDRDEFALSILHEEPEPALPRTEGEDEETVEEEEVEPEQREGKADPHAWLREDKPSGSSDIAQAAQQHLALRNFSPAEQQQIISEGEGDQAGNLDLLDLTGTHYTALEEIQDDDDQMGWL